MIWPEWVLIPQSISPMHIIPMNTSGGRSPTGGEQIVGNSAGRNRVALNGIMVATAEHERVWRTIAANLGGRSGVIMVPAFGRRTAPWPTVGGIRMPSASSIVLTDDILFGNGVGLYARTIVAVANAAVAPGAVTMAIKLMQGASIKAGQIFQAGEFAYTISKIVSSTLDAPPVFTVNFRPPLRVAIANGADLELDNPRFRARLEDDNAMALDLQMWRFGSASVAFVEDC